MASLHLSKLEQIELRDATGLPAVGYFLHFFITGTTTYKNTYPTEADAIAGTNANANPITLDSQGRSPVDIWITGRYKRVFTSESVVPISSGITTDPVEDVVTASDAQDASPTYGGTNTGTADVILFSTSPALTAYAAGATFRGRITADNTTAVTVNINGVGAKSLVKRDGTALIAGDLQGPDIIEFSRDATSDVFRLLSPDGYAARVSNGVSGAQGLAAVRTYTASDTWTKPANLTYVIVEVVGGGGGGGGAGTNSGALGSGGGGGGYSSEKIAVGTLGATETVTIGAAGSAGADTGGNGGTGGTTSFGALLSAVGGTGGTGNTTANTATAGGDGGAGSGGDVNLTGEAGSCTIGDTGAVLGIASGRGGMSAKAFGAGGKERPVAGAGAAGIVYGGGGGGAKRAGANVAGGAGAAGICIVYEYV